MVTKAKEVRITTRGGDTVAYFENPQLLFQSHDLKNSFSRQTLKGSLTFFKSTILPAFNSDHIDLRSCWLDIGYRDHATAPSSGIPAESGPYTLL